MRRRETLAQRAQRREQTRLIVKALDKPPRKLRNGHVVDTHFMQQVARYYRQGKYIKDIASKMGCGFQTIVRIVRELQLTDRKVNGRIKTRIDIKLTDKLIADIDVNIHNKYRSRSDYIRQLIEADLYE